MLIKLVGGITSIRMIQLCGKEIILPLQLFFKSMLEEDTFLEDWRKSNIVPVHKKESTNLIKIIVQLVFFLSSVKYLKGLYSILCLITLCKINFLQSVSQVSYLVTQALHNCCQLHMKSINILIVTHQLRRGKFFLIF